MVLDSLAYYRGTPRYCGPRLEELLSKELLIGKILYIEPKEEINWHQFVKEHGPGANCYAAYNLALVKFEETLCSK